MNNLNEQAFHPGKQRNEPDDKRRVGLAKVDKVDAWIERNMESFLRKLQKPHNEIWKPDMADPSKLAECPVPVYLHNAAASSHPGMWRVITYNF